MKKKAINPLKVLRVILALILFTPMLLFFVDFTDVLPDSFSALFHLQIMPIFFSGVVILLVIYLLLTLFFGRIYCSVLCPAGILQDIINRIACIGKKKKDGKMRFQYHKPANWLRYVILGVTALLAVFGITEFCLLLDPYSNFGRIVTHLFQPIVIWVNNLLSEFLTARGNYSLYNVSVDISIPAIIAALIALDVFALMAYFRGRLFCNTICPVGALLSLVSRHSLFRITIDENACNKCKVCERSCKAEAIDSTNGKTDMSNCVTCFNCISSCNKKAIQFRFAPAASFPKKQMKPEMPKQQDISDNKFTESRRSFITTSVSLAGAVPLLALAQGHNHANGKLPITPPGSLNIERFKDYCTGCHLCVVQCPSHVLKPAGLEYGPDYMLKPYMSFEKKYCNYSCTVCSQVCPTHAIKPITEEEKKVVQVGVVEFHKGMCVVYTDETDCGACTEHCPTKAVYMVPYKGTLTIPNINPNICIGCGGCESICPVRPNRAIAVRANAVHQTAEKPKEEEVREVNLDNFGF